MKRKAIIMENITQKLALAGLVLGSIGSVDIEAAYFRGLWSRAVLATRNSKLFGSYKTLGLGAASTGSVAYGFWPFNKSKQQNSDKRRDPWKQFDIEVLDGERSYLNQYIRTKDRGDEQGWNIYYGFPSLNERFNATHPHLQIKGNLKRNKATGRDTLHSVNINMEKCKIYRGVGTDSSIVRVSCREDLNNQNSQDSNRLFDYLFRPVGKVYDDQHKEIELGTSQNVRFFFWPQHRDEK